MAGAASRGRAFNAKDGPRPEAAIAGSRGGYGRRLHADNPEIAGQHDRAFRLPAWRRGRSAIVGASRHRPEHQRAMEVVKRKLCAIDRFGNGREDYAVTGAMQIVQVRYAVGNMDMNVAVDDADRAITGRRSSEGIVWPLSGGGRS